MMMTRRQMMAAATAAAAMTTASAAKARDAAGLDAALQTAFDGAENSRFGRDGGGARRGDMDWR